MSIEYFTCRVWRFISIVALLVSIFLVYFNLPEKVAVHHENDKAVEFMPKNTIFYIAVGLAIGINLLLGFLEKIFSNIPNTSFAFLQATGWYNHRAELNMRFSNWIRMLQGCMNFMVCLTLYALVMVNIPDANKTISNYKWILMVGVVALLIWLFWLPIRILFLKPKP